MKTLATLTRSLLATAALIAASGAAQPDAPPAFRPRTEEAPALGQGAIGRVPLELADLETIKSYNRKATGEKYLINPSL